MYKYLFFLLILLLGSCSKDPLLKYLEKEELRKEFRKSSNDSCPLGYLDNSKDFLVASIFFKNNKSDISQEDKEIIKKVASIHSYCPKTILMVSHASHLESENDLLKGAKISFARINSVTKEMQNNKVSGNYINVLFCSFSNNLVDENNYENKNANLYNQRVDIVFLNTPIEQYEFGCISSKKKKISKNYDNIKYQITN